MELAPDMIGAIAGSVIALTVFIAIFLICRAIVLWYWKIDKIVNLLERIESHLAPEVPDAPIEPKKEVNNWEV